MVHFEISVGLFLESNGAVHHLTKQDGHCVGQKARELFLVIFHHKSTRGAL